MEAETVLKVYAECKKKLKTIEGAECSECPLSKDVRLAMEAQTPGTGVLSEITMQVNPCLLITEVAGQL